MPERLNHWDADPPSVRHQGDSVTTGSLPLTEDPEHSQRPPRVRAPIGRWLGIFMAGVLVLGVLSGVLWSGIVPLSTYQVNGEGSATTTERGLAGFVAGDAWFALIALVLGVVCGVVAWRWFAGLGWPVVPLAMAGSTAMSLLCWSVGWFLGPGSFEARLATATPGQTLPIELTVRAPAALLVGPFGAVLVIMLLVALGRDPDDTGEEPMDAAA